MSRLVEPAGTDVTSGNEMAMTSSDRPSLRPLVVRLRTRSAVGPTGKPGGTLTVRRFFVASTVAMAVPREVSVGPLEGMNETSFLDATGSNPVPTMLMVTSEEAPIGVTDVSKPDCALVTAPTARAIRSVHARTQDRVEVSAARVVPFLNRDTGQDSCGNESVFAAAPPSRGRWPARQSKPVPASTRDPGKRLPVGCLVIWARR